MSFSLINTPTTFQQFINDIFSNLLDVCIMIYLDDILIYSYNMSVHYQHVKKVLKHLCKASFYTMNNLQYLSEQQFLYFLYITQQLLLISISYTKIFLLFLDSRIFVPSSDSLHTHVLQYNHDYILAGNFSQNKITHLPHKNFFSSNYYHS